jgi:putative peptidoglycan lipid II flippase
MGLGVLAKLAVDLVVIAGFGLTGATDAFFVAYTLLILTESLIYPACQSGLVPIFVGAQAAGGRERVWAVFNSLFTLAGLFGLLLAAGGIFGSALLTGLLAPGLAAATSALAANLTALMLTGLLFVPLIGVLRAMLNAHNLFGAPAALELIRGATVICVVGISIALAGVQRIEALAVGFAVAAFAQAVILGGVVIRQLGFGYRPALHLPLLRATGVRRMLTVPLLDNAIGQGVLVVERVIGSFLPAGSITALSYGHRLASVIGNTLFTGIEVVSLSALAASLTEGSANRRREAYTTLLTGVRLVVILGVPVGLAVWALKLPLIQLIFSPGDGSVGAEAALVLGIYAVTIPLYGYLLVSRNYLFAAGRPQLALPAACTQLVGMAVAAPLLAQAFGIAGVAWAYMIGQALACAMAALMLGRVAGATLGGALPALVGKVLGASLVMAGMMALINALMAPWLSALGSAPTLTRLLILSGAGGIGGICLLGLLLALQVEEAHALRNYAVALLFGRAHAGPPTGVEQEA